MKDNEIERALKDLKREVVDQNKATRGHVSAVFDGIAHNTEVIKETTRSMADEQRGQLTAIKERVQFLIKMFDDFVKRVMKGLKKTWPGDSK